MESMEHVAVDNAVALAAIALVGSILAMVVQPLFKLLGANAKATDKLASSMNALVEETRKGNREAKERNGHLGEQNVQITKMITVAQKEAAVREQRLVGAIQNVTEQHVVTQKVDKAEVVDEVIKSETVHRKR